MLALTMSVIAMVAGASLCYGVLCTMDTFRLMATNGIFDSWESPIGNNWPLFLFPGIFGAALAGTLGQKAAVAYGGRLGTAIVAIPFTS